MKRMPASQLYYIIVLFPVFHPRQGLVLVSIQQCFAMSVHVAMPLCTQRTPEGFNQYGAT
jgi:hypothetical protein